MEKNSTSDDLTLRDRPGLAAQFDQLAAGLVASQVTRDPEDPTILEGLRQAVEERRQS